MSLRFIMIEADGESATATIEAALNVLAGKGRPAAAAALSAPATVALPAPEPRPPRASPRFGYGKKKSKRRGVQTGSRDDGAQPSAPAGGRRDEAVEANGVTVTLAKGDERLSYRARETEITDKQARFLAALAVAMPAPVGREFLAKKVWGANPPATFTTGLSMLVTGSQAAAASVGLVVKTVPGVGIALQPAEGES